MKINADIIYQNLTQQLTVKRMGRNIKTMSLSNQLFLRDKTKLQSGKVYLAYVNELPSAKPAEDCLIICVGGGPPKTWNPGRSCVFNISDELDLFQISNIMQSIYERYDEWDGKLREILDGNASIAEMIRISAPLLDNPISLCNNRLEIEAISAPADYVNVPGIGPISEDLTHQFLSQHTSNTARREPFLYELEGLSAYCINIYKQDNYLGVITLGDRNRRFEPGDFEIFRYLYSFVSKAAEKRTNIASGQFVTLKAVRFLNSSYKFDAVYILVYTYLRGENDGYSKIIYERSKPSSTLAKGLQIFRQ